jgi:hypothetical protein
MENDNREQNQTKYMGLPPAPAQETLHSHEGTFFPIPDLSWALADCLFQPPGD